MARDLSDASLSHQLEGFLAYRARCGPLSFREWAETKDLSPDDLAYLEGLYVTVRQGRAS